MNTGEWQIKIMDVGYKLDREIYIFRILPDNRTELLGGEVIKYGTKPDPTLELSPEQLQAFADALGGAGFKPDKGFTEGKLLATEKHLEDMRTLALHNPPEQDTKG